MPASARAAAAPTVARTGRGEARAAWADIGRLLGWYSEDGIRMARALAAQHALPLGPALEALFDAGRPRLTEVDLAARAATERLVAVAIEEVNSSIRAG